MCSFCIVLSSYMSGSIMVCIFSNKFAGNRTVLHSMLLFCPCCLVPHLSPTLPHCSCDCCFWASFICQRCIWLSTNLWNGHPAVLQAQIWALGAYSWRISSLLWTSSWSCALFIYPLYHDDGSVACGSCGLLPAQCPGPLCLDMFRTLFVPSRRSRSHFNISCPLHVHSLLCRYALYPPPYLFLHPYWPIRHSFRCRCPHGSHMAWMCTCALSLIVLHLS